MYHYEGDDDDPSNWRPAVWIDYEPLTAAEIVGVAFMFAGLAGFVASVVAGLVAAL